MKENAIFVISDIICVCVRAQCSPNIDYVIFAQSVFHLSVCLSSVRLLSVCLSLFLSREGKVFCLYKILILIFWRFITNGLVNLSSPLSLHLAPCKYNNLITHWSTLRARESKLRKQHGDSAQQQTEPVYKTWTTYYVKYETELRITWHCGSSCNEQRMPFFVFFWWSE